MPCDTVSTVSVDLGKIADPKLLEQTLKDMGYSNAVYHETRNEIYFGIGGRINVKTGASDLPLRTNVNEIKRNYSKTVLKTQAKRFGWQVKEQQDGTFEVVKARRL